MGGNRFQCVCVQKKKNKALIIHTSAENISSGDIVAQNQVLRQDTCRVLLNGLCFLACFQDHASHFISLSWFVQSIT